MDKNKVAKSLLKLANELIKDDSQKTAAPEEQGDGDNVVKKKDPKLNAIVNKVDSAVGADVDSLLTLILMVLQKNGKKQEATKLYSLFRPLMKKVASKQEDRKRLTQR